MSETGKKKLFCSFCSKSEAEVKKLIAGPNVYICDDCVGLCHDILSTDKPEDAQMAVEVATSEPSPNPTKVKEFLDQYIIGQDYAKMVVSVAVANHHKRLNFPVVDGVEIEKSNILIFGPTGSGKTLIAQTIAKYLEVPFVITDATSLTEAGYVGDDVESIVTKLLQAAGGDVSKAERGIIYLDEIDKKHKKESGGGGRDVSGEGVQQSLLKILEGTEVMVPTTGTKKNTQSELVKVNTKNILFIVGGAFVGLDKVVEKSLNKDSGLGFTSKIAEVGKPMDDLLRHAKPEHLVQFGIIPELIGRLPVTAPLEELAASQLVRVLTEPKNAVVKQFTTLFAIDGVELVFDEGALEEVAKIAKDRKTGARGLRSVIENKLIKTQFNLQNFRAAGATKVIVTKETFTNDEEPRIIYGETLALALTGK